MDLTGSITYHITKTGNMLRQLAAKRIKEAGIDLTPEESVILNQLWDQDNQTLSELGKWSVKEPSTLTRQVDSLVKKGYVERIHGTEDRRQVFVKLTDDGAGLQKRFAETGVSALDKDMAQLSDEDIAQALKVLLAVREQVMTELQKK